MITQGNPGYTLGFVNPGYTLGFEPYDSKWKADKIINGRFHMKEYSG